MLAPAAKHCSEVELPVITWLAVDGLAAKSSCLSFHISTFDIARAVQSLIGNNNVLKLSKCYSNLLLPGSA